MKLVFVVLLIAVIFLGALIEKSAATAAERPLSRQRRGIHQMARMIKATTGHHHAAYVGYGNYCGFGGAGVPVDNIDRCCQAHDLCYGAIQKLQATMKCGEKGIRGFSLYGSKFNYKDLGNGEFECIDDRSSGYSSCLLDLCTCDKVFAYCLRPVKNEYNATHLRESKIFLRDLVRLVRV